VGAVVRFFFRILIGIAGVLGLLAACTFWLEPDRAGSGIGLLVANATGNATIRADIGGFFGASGLFALIAAIRGDARFALGTLVLMAFALFGRVLNLLLSGWNPIFLPPMLIEVFVIAVFAFAWRALRETEQIQAGQ